MEYVKSWINKKKNGMIYLCNLNTRISTAFDENCLKSYLFHFLQYTMQKVVLYFLF